MKNRQRIRLVSKATTVARIIDKKSLQTIYKFSGCERELAPRCHGSHISSLAQKVSLPPQNMQATPAGCSRTE